MRTFIAVGISQTVKEQIDELVENMKKGIVRTGCHPKWVKTENVHLTLKFLGNIEEAQVPEIKTAIDDIASQFKPFTVRLSGLGMFPSKRQPRVLWIGFTKGEQALIKMQTLLERKLGDIGFPVESRRFHPHLTLARIKSLKGTAGLADIVSIYKTANCGECPIDKITFFKSTLTPQGPIYNAISEHALEEGETSKK